MLKVAIIILSYNSLDETTKPCVESVLRASSGLEFKLLVVDNGSTDGTSEYLKVVERERQNVGIVINGSNLGYAAGNNVGIRTLEAEYYVLLNSDTVVTDRWLDGLIGFLDTHPDAGCAGPVSNSVGNEQMIHVQSSDEAGTIREGLAWATKCQGDFFLTSMLGFFCVAIRREVIDKVGFLDEAFGIGTFEDDDYCLRVAQHGFHLACIEDVFVYHKGSLSFRKARIPKVDEIFHRNQHRYEEKHRVVWRSHLTPLSFLDLIETYLSMHCNEPDKLVYKIGNKLRILKQLYQTQPCNAFGSLRQRVARALSWRTRAMASALTRNLLKLPLIRYMLRAVFAGRE